jgi:hypothetical protein
LRSAALEAEKAIEVVIAFEFSGLRIQAFKLNPSETETLKVRRVAPRGSKSRTLRAALIKSRRDAQDAKLKFVAFASN